MRILIKNSARWALFRGENTIGSFEAVRTVTEAEETAEIFGKRVGEKLTLLSARDKSDNSGVAVRAGDGVCLMDADLEDTGLAPAYRVTAVKEFNAYLQIEAEKI